MSLQTNQKTVFIVADFQAQRLAILAEIYGYLLRKRAARLAQQQEAQYEHKPE